MKKCLCTFLSLLVLITLPTLVFAQGGGSYSGDDLYDPAAGSLEAQTAQFVANFSGDDAYDLAAGGQPAKSPPAFVNRFSGDDAYDPAAGGLYYEPTLRYVTNFSGDDAYDPACCWMSLGVELVLSPGP